jgi:hypothetical protein
VKVKPLLSDHASRQDEIVWGQARDSRLSAQV